MGDRAYINAYDMDDDVAWFIPELHHAKNGKTYCINGTHPKYLSMMNDHLINTIRYIENNADFGIAITRLGETFYGKEAKDKMNYQLYTKEAKKRKLKW
jgi:hypothetical protein|tara:strand:+ start:87 stop:383 length:297 start_codon:yes stop_codon:yes gene_type:complete